MKTWSFTSFLIVCRKLADFRFQWPRRLRRRSAAVRLLRLVSNSARAMDVCCECCLCYELITRPEESYRLWCVVVCNLETSRIRRPWPTSDRQLHRGRGWGVWGCGWGRRKLPDLGIITSNDVRNLQPH